MGLLYLVQCSLLGSCSRTWLCNWLVFLKCGRCFYLVSSSSCSYDDLVFGARAARLQWLTESRNTELATAVQRHQWTEEIKTLLFPAVNTMWFVAWHGLTVKCYVPKSLTFQKCFFACVIYRLNEVRLIAESFNAYFTWCGWFLSVCMSTYLSGRSVTLL